MSSGTVQNKSIFLMVGVLVILGGLFTGIQKLLFSGETSIAEIIREQGYREIKPPSFLLQPGTWVKVRNDTPLHLDVICFVENSLGSETLEKMRNSDSIDIESITKLNDSYKFNIDELGKLTSKSEFKNIQNISFTLKNVKFIELPDEAVFGGIKKRSDECDEAIRFRVKKGQKITMIKSVLIADAIYKVDYKRRLKTEEEAALKRNLALEMGLKLEALEQGKSQIVGHNLIWGIRDDLDLAMLGIALPATGGNNKQNTNSLVSVDLQISSSSVTEINTSITRKKLEREVIKYNVNPIRQNSTMSCWATVYTMMKSWKISEELTIQKAVSSLGNEWIDYYLFDEGLPGGLEKKFVAATGMASSPPASYPLETYVELLREHGPLWIITGDGLTSHAKLLVGIYGHDKAESIDQYGETIFEFIDPTTGSFTYKSALDFTRNFEEEARWLVDKKSSNDFRDQILYWP